MIKCFKEALRTRGLARLPFVLFALLFSLVWQVEPNQALGQTDSRHPTFIKHSRSHLQSAVPGIRGQKVALEAALSVWSGDMARMKYVPLQETVHFYIAEGSTWKYLGRRKAKEKWFHRPGAGFQRYADAYASLDWMIPLNQPSGFQRVKFEFFGNNWARPCVGYGWVWVR